MKSAVADDAGRQRFRFDFDGGLETWLSVDGITDRAEGFIVPVTNAQCKQHFIDNDDDLTTTAGDS